GTAQRSSALGERVPTWLLHRATQYACDLFAGCAALYCAYLLRFDGHIPPGHAYVMWFWIMFLPVVRVASLYAFGCYHAIWRHFSVYPDVEVVGLISPDRKAHGLRIGGFAVMDEPAALPEILTRQAIDLVLIADASLESLGAMVATATEFGSDVRLMPSAASI